MADKKKSLEERQAEADKLTVAYHAELGKKAKPAKKPAVKRAKPQVESDGTA